MSETPAGEHSADYDTPETACFTLCGPSVFRPVIDGHPAFPLGGSDA